jgi:hypothetical protein
VPHSKQSDGEVAPLDVVYFPVPHCKQEDAPLNAEYFPGEQVRHVDKLVAPDSVEYVPGAHPPTIWLDTRGTAHIAITVTFINLAHVIFKRKYQHTYIQVISYPTIHLELSARRVRPFTKKSVACFSGERGHLDQQPDFAQLLHKTPL